MEFIETSIEGAYLIENIKEFDSRGYFQRIFCQKEFDGTSLSDVFVQTSASYNEKKYTLRGMHYQIEPFAESKLIYCTRGSFYDVIVDLRADSPTFKVWYSVILDESLGYSLYVPPGCAHGFLTLEPKTFVFYQISQYHSKECERGFKWNDPSLNIDWPHPPLEISNRDMNLPFIY